MLKKLFATKYRIMFAYSCEERVGFVVFEKRFLCQWMPARLVEVGRSEDGRTVLREKDAFFKTEDEAKEFIGRKNTIY